MKPTSAPPGRDVKGALIKTRAALPHPIIGSLLWLVVLVALPTTIGVGVTVVVASWYFTYFDGSQEGTRRWQSAFHKGRFIRPVLLTNYGPIIPVLGSDGTCNLAAMSDDEGSES